MKILLLKPPSHHAGYGSMIPIGLAYVAGALLKEGHKVKAIDFSLTDMEWERKHQISTSERQELVEKPDKWERMEEELRTEIIRLQPDLIGFTCNSSERFGMFKLLKIVRKYTESPIVAGGPHVTLLAEETMANIKEIDFVVRGEGEITMVELCQKIEAGKSMAEVKGISYRYDGKIISNPDRELIQDLDTIPFPARDIFKNEAYKYSMPLTYLKNNVTGIVTSRGCPMRCNFCSDIVLWRGKIRERTASNVVDEIEDVLTKYPFYNGIFMCDEHFFFNRKRAIEICQEIKKRSLDFIWGAQGRADIINHELVKEMASAGCKLISFGVESGSNRVLKLMNKKQNLNTVKKAVKLCSKFEIQPRGTFIFGYPGESILDFMKTLKTLYYFEPNSVNYTTSLVLYPGTHDTNRFLKDFDWCADISLDIPHVANIPVYTHKNDPLRSKLALQLVRPIFWFYYLTHPEYIIKKTIH